MKKRIQIKRRGAVVFGFEEWTEAAVAFHRQLNLSDYLEGEDTAIEQLYFSKDSYEAILHFATHSFIKDGITPEVGGFLFGKVKKKAKERFEVRIEKFVPVLHPEKNNAMELEMGISAGLVLEENNEVDNGLFLLGWFHTDPGHSPYLSTTDLNRIHDLFFTQPFGWAFC